jgi:hypothetical protein
MSPTLMLRSSRREEAHSFTPQLEPPYVGCYEY